jgi:hypothetical protein
MAVLLTVGLALVFLAFVPGLRRSPVLLALAGLVAALVARSITQDSFLVVAAGVLPVLVGLLVREMTETLDLVAEPRREIRRVRRLERRELERRREARERERRRRLAA